MALPVWFYLLQWITLSCAMILLNKQILSGWGFSYPCFLTAWHMLFSTILTQILIRTTKLMPSAQSSENKVTAEVLKNKIIPIALCFSVSIMLGNKAYLFLSVSYIQMLKAFIPVLVLLLGIALGVEKPSKIQLCIVFMISIGVFISSVGELRFSLIGFVYQISAILAESIRLVLSDRLLKDLKLDPLSLLYYQSPICLIFIVIAFTVVELDNFPIEIFQDQFLVFMLLVSGISAFALNIAVVLLITNSSALIMTLGGIAKDILLVVFSMVIFASPVSLLQAFGYAVSLAGMNLYKNFKSSPDRFTEDVISRWNFLASTMRLRGSTSSQSSTTVDINAEIEAATKLLQEEDDIDNVVTITTSNTPVSAAVPLESASGKL